MALEYIVVVDTPGVGKTALVTEFTTPTADSRLFWSTFHEHYRPLGLDSPEGTFSVQSSVLTVKCTGSSSKKEMAKKEKLARKLETKRYKR